MLGIIIVASVFVITGIGLAIYGGFIKKTMDPVSLYRVASCLVVASLIAGCFSFFAICLSLSSPQSEGLSNQEAIVDILGILVTILMGWNIISLVDFKKKVDTIDYISQDFKSVISAVMQLNFNNFMMKGNKDEQLDSCMTALEKVHGCVDDNIRKMAEGQILDLVKHLCEEMKNENNRLVFEGKKNEYAHILSNVDSKYTKDLEEFIKSADESKQTLRSDAEVGGELLYFASSSSSSSSE